MAQVSMVQAHLDGKVASTPKASGNHTVVKNDTLYSIAQKYTTDVQTIKSLNGLSSDTIHVGDKLSIAGTVADKPKEVSKPVVAAPKYTTESQNVGGVQTFLNKWFDGGLTVDNITGAATEKALIKALQTELNRQFNAGLKVDGYWGAKTKAACATVRKGASGNITRLIQAALICKGYDVGKFNGVFSDDLYNAVIRFQKAKGLSAYGIVGKDTFEALFK